MQRCLGAGSIFLTLMSFAQDNLRFHNLLGGVYTWDKVISKWPDVLLQTRKGINENISYHLLDTYFMPNSLS